MTTEGGIVEPAAPPRPGGARHVVDVAGLTRRTEALLRAGVPLSLLLDLAEEGGPRSSARYADEGGDASWLSAPAG